MPLIAFLGVSYVQREGGHIRMDILISRFKGRALWPAELLTVSLMLSLMMMLVWGGWAHFERRFDLAMPLWSRDSSMDIALPIWPAKLLAPVAFAVLCVQLAPQAADMCWRSSTTLSNRWHCRCRWMRQHRPPVKLNPFLGLAAILTAAAQMEAGDDQP